MSYDGVGGARGAPGGGLPAGADEGNLLQWDADTSTWIPVGAPAQSGQIIVWNNTTEEWEVSSGAPYYPDPPLFVTKATGNDANDGRTAGTAIQTLSELGRRYYGRFVTETNPIITLDGTFLEPLFLECAGIPGNLLRVNGTTPTTIDSGTLTAASQAYNATTNTDCRITDAAQAWAGNVDARIRFTSGPANGNIAWVLADLGAGVARIGQLVNRTTGNASPLPGIGDTYVIERLNTQIAGFRVDIKGGMRFAGHDLNDHCEANTQTVQYLRASGCLPLTTDQAPECKLVGCMFENAVIAATIAHNFTMSFFGLWGTHSRVAWRQSHSRVFVNSHSSTQSFGLNAGSRCDVQVHLIMQGAGVVLFPYSTITCTVDGAAAPAAIGFYGAAGSACLDLDCHTQFTSVLAGNTVMGLGNTSTQTVRIRTGGGFYFLGLPSVAPAIGPAVDVLVGGFAVAWAAVGAGSQANGAVCAPRA